MSNYFKSKLDRSGCHLHLDYESTVLRSYEQEEAARCQEQGAASAGAKKSRALEESNTPHNIPRRQGKR